MWRFGVVIPWKCDRIREAAKQMEREAKTLLRAMFDSAISSGETPPPETQENEEAA